MKHGLFCPSCGSTKGPFFKGLCKRCFLSQRKLILVPAEIKIEHCVACNRIRLEGKWVEQNAAVLKAFLRKKIKVKELSEPRIEIELEPIEENTLAIIKASGLLDGNRIEAEEKTLLVGVERQCNDCMLLRSNYSEATIQIRFSHKPSEKEKSSLLLEISKSLSLMKGENRLARIVNIVDRKNGFDAVFGANKAAQKVVKSLSAKALQPVKRSFKVKGRDKKGKQRRKFTYCLRF